MYNWLYYIDFDVFIHKHYVQKHAPFNPWQTHGFQHLMRIISGLSLFQTSWGSIPPCPPNKVAAIFVVIAMNKLFLPLDLTKKHFKTHQISSSSFFSQGYHAKFRIDLLKRVDYATDIIYIALTKPNYPFIKLCDSRYMGDCMVIKIITINDFSVCFTKCQSHPYSRDILVIN